MKKHIFKLAILLGMFFPCKTEAAFWYSASWLYRKPIAITGAATAQTDYQVRVTVAYVTGKMNANFSDIRFLASNNTTVLSYWEESVTNSVSAVFVVKVPSIPTSGTTIYMYFGNTAATSLKTTAVFSVFYDCSDLTGWFGDGKNGVPKAKLDLLFGNPEPSFSAVSGQYAYRNITLTANSIVEYDGYVTGGGTSLSNLYFLTDTAGVGQMFRLEARASTSSGFASTPGWTGWNAPTGYGPVTANVWHRVRLAIGATTAYGYVDDASYGSYTFSNKGGVIAVHGDVADTLNYFDNIRVRKFAEPEPVGTVGMEEGRNSSFFLLFN